MRRLSRGTAWAGLLLMLPVQAALPDFSWLAGAWCGERGAARLEEHWTRPAGDALLGVGRVLQDGRMLGFEFLRIELREGVVHPLAQPGGAPATAFALAEHAAQSATFVNPAHDFPQRVRYWRDGAQLRAQISGPDGQGGERRIDYLFRACD